MFRRDEWLSDDIAIGLFVTIVILILFTGGLGLLMVYKSKDDEDIGGQFWFFKIFSTITDGLCTAYFGHITNFDWTFGLSVIDNCLDLLTIFLACACEGKNIFFCNLCLHGKIAVDPSEIQQAGITLME